jgi:hypothetical protein
MACLKNEKERNNKSLYRLVFLRLSSDQTVPQSMKTYFAHLGTCAKKFAQGQIFEKIHEKIYRNTLFKYLKTLLQTGGPGSCL